MPWPAPQYLQSLRECMTYQINLLLRVHNTRGCWTYSPRDSKKKKVGISQRRTRSDWSNFQSVLNVTPGKNILGQSEKGWKKIDQSDTVNQTTPPGCVCGDVPHHFLPRNCWDLGLWVTFCIWFVKAGLSSDWVASVKVNCWIHGNFPSVLSFFEARHGQILTLFMSNDDNFHHLFIS